MAHGVADGIHQWEDFQQQSLLARAPAEIVGNGLNEFLAPRAHAFSKSRRARIRRGASGG
jgi:hypothetical protein